MYTGCRRSNVSNTVRYDKFYALIATKPIIGEAILLFFFLSKITNCQTDASKYINRQSSSTASHLNFARFHDRSDRDESIVSRFELSFDRRAILSSALSYLRPRAESIIKKNRRGKV